MTKWYYTLQHIDSNCCVHVYIGHEECAIGDLSSLVRGKLISETIYTILYIMCGILRLLF